MVCAALFGCASANLTHNHPSAVERRDSVLAAAARDDLTAVVREILVAAGREDQAIAVRSTKDSYIAAAHSFAGVPEISYNAAAIASLRPEAEGEWAVVFLMAHEVAHHLVGHTTTAVPSSEEEFVVAELDVNGIAGAVLRRLGASLKEAKGAAAAACRIDKASEAPTRATVSAVENGWHRASGSIGALPVR